MSFTWIVRLIKEFWPLFLKGTVTTLEITLIGTIIGYIIGFLIGIIKTSPIDNEKHSFKSVLMRIIKFLCNAYILIFRGTPMIVQAMVIYFGSIQALNINISSFEAAIIVVSLNTGAYMSETVRGGIQSVEFGQQEGAKALGMKHFTTMMNVVMPQVFSNILPQMGNTFISNVKDTSVLNIISVTELFFTTKTVAGKYFHYFEAYLITAAIYLVLTVVLDAVFKVVEKKTAIKSDYKMIDVEQYEKEVLL